jgi:predicted peptidase
MTCQDKPMRFRDISIGALPLAGLSALFAGCSSTPPGEPGTQVSGRFEGHVARPVAYDYLLYLPEGYGAEEQRWPLVLFLHGAGQRGDDIERLKEHGPPKLVAQGRSFPFILVSPQVPEGQWWDTEALAVLLDHVMATYAVDADRVYLTGLSMGGAGAWSLATHSPERFAAVVPICGAGLDLYRGRQRLTGVPIWAFHGAQDELVPVELSRLIVESVRMGGGNVKFTVYPDVGHDSWTRTYDNPELWEWLLSQQRTSATDPAP